MRKGVSGFQVPSFGYALLCQHVSNLSIGGVSQARHFNDAVRIWLCPNLKLETPHLITGIGE
jgi:hypothetical protein